MFCTSFPTIVHRKRKEERTHARVIHKRIAALVCALYFLYMKRSKETFVDGFVFAVPKKNVVAYKKMAREAAVVWKKFGALDYKECMGTDLKTKGSHGMPAPRSFVTLTKAKPTETVWFSYITYKNKKHRDMVNKKVMAFFAKKYKGKEDMPMPFDVRRMSYGGFSVIVG